jgi:hypothetical protein
MQITESNVVQFGSFMLSEPITAITDVLLALLCFIIIFRLRVLKKETGSYSAWSFFFLGMGLSTLTGTIVHGCRHYQTEDAHYNTWMFMNVLSGLSVFFAQLATVKYIHQRSKHAKLLQTIAWIQLVCYFVLILIFRSFNVVKIQVAVAMIPVMIIHIAGFRKGIKGGGWVGAGIGMSFFSAVFHTFKISINEIWFNYNDLSHVFIGASFILIATGVLKGAEKEAAGGSGS